MIANQKIEYIKQSTIEQCIEKEGILIHEDYNKFQESYITTRNIDYITEEIQNKVILEYLLQNVLKTNGSVTKEDVSKYRIITSNILEKFKYNKALIELVTNHKEISSKISSIYHYSWNCIWLFLILHVMVAIIFLIQVIGFCNDSDRLIVVIFILFTLLPLIIPICNKEIYIENKLNNIKDAIKLYNSFTFSFINHILIPLLYLCYVAMIVLYIFGVIDKGSFDMIKHSYEIFDLDICLILIFIMLCISIISIIYIFIKRYQYKQYRTTKNTDYITINKDGVYIHDVKYELTQ